MIYASLDEDGILVQADSADAPIAARMPSATHTASMPPRTWRMPLTCESTDALRDAKARTSPELAAEAKRLSATRRYVEAQKQAEIVKPLRAMPVKPGIRLYNHQVKAYNIALALFGYAPAQGGDVQ